MCAAVLETSPLLRIRVGVIEDEVPFALLISFPVSGSASGYIPSGVLEQPKNKGRVHKTTNSLFAPYSQDLDD